MVEFTNGGLARWKYVLFLNPVLGLIFFIFKNNIFQCLKDIGVLSFVSLSIPAFVWPPLQILVSNQWYFAEGVGDDGARWFMMEDY